MHKLDNKVLPQQGRCTSLIANRYTTEDCNRLSFSPVVDIPSGPCSNYIPLGLQIMTFHILASNLCTAACALGGYVTLCDPPLCFLRLNYTSAVDVFDCVERKADLFWHDKRMGRTPPSLCPPAGGRNEGWEGWRAWQGAEMWDTFSHGFGWCEICWLFLSLCLFFCPLLFHLETKDTQILVRDYLNQ